MQISLSVLLKFEVFLTGGLKTNYQKLQSYFLKIRYAINHHNSSNV